MWQWIQGFKEATSFIINSGNLIHSTKADWLHVNKGDSKKIKLIIDISNMGERVLKSHMKSERQKNNSGSRQPVTLSSFGFVSCAKYVILIIETQLSECL